MQAGLKRVRVASVTGDWGLDQLDDMAGATVAGHLLECGTYLTGSNYADPPNRPVPGMEDLGMPMPRVYDSGEAVLSKLPEARGILTTNTCKAQLIYEIGDPASLITPDIIARSGDKGDTSNIGMVPYNEGAATG